MDDETKFVVKLFVGIGVLVLLVVVCWMAFMPKYRIYRQDMAGQANLRQQEWEKKILVEQARAENDSATLKAEAQVKQAVAQASAEIERARGVAEANKIIGESLKGNEAYLKYLMIDTLKDQNTQLIYIPTEAGLPILEAGK